MYVFFFGFIFALPFQKLNLKIIQINHTDKNCFGQIRLVTAVGLMDLKDY
jgi:hypothetical protein